MIIEYLRPDRMADAIGLLSRTGITSKPLAGGTVLSKQKAVEDFAVVDLQKLGLDFIVTSGNLTEIGATCTLQKLIEIDMIHAALRSAVDREVSFHMRNMATAGGTVISADGCSPLLTALTALDTVLTWQPGDKQLPLGEWLNGRKTAKAGVLLEKLAYDNTLKLKCKFLARSPQDYPMASLAISESPDGKMRIAIGAIREEHPIVIYDGNSGADGLKAVENTCNSFLAGRKHEAYLTSVLPGMVGQMIQEGI